jgi:hypothetical protein
VDNIEKFQINSDIHSINTRHKHGFRMPNASLTSYQKDAYYAGIEVLNTHPSNFKSLNLDIKYLSQH